MNLTNVEVRKFIDKSHNVIVDFFFEENNDNKEKIKIAVIMSEDYKNDNTDYENIIAEKLLTFSKSELENMEYKAFYANSDSGVEILKIWAKENNIR